MAPRASPVWVGLGSGTQVDSEFKGHVGWNVCREYPDVTEERAAPFIDDVSDVGETRALQDHNIGDEVAPVYPEQSALASYLKGLQFPPILLE